MLEAPRRVFVVAAGTEGGKKAEAWKRADGAMSSAHRRGGSRHQARKCRRSGAQPFAASDIPSTMIEPVSLLAASLISLAPLPVRAGTDPGASLRATRAIPRLTRGHRLPRCTHGARAAMVLPAEAAHWSAGGSPLPDLAGAAAGRPAPLFVAGGAHFLTGGERDQEAPIPLLLLTRSLLI
jgi:hypothetical protein